METIKDAGYQIILNKTLRQKFLEIYNEFPELYDKHSFKSRDVRRVYSNHYGDYEKITGVLAEAAKDEELQNRVDYILADFLACAVINMEKTKMTPVAENYVKSKYRYLYRYFIETDGTDEIIKTMKIKMTLKPYEVQPFKETSKSLSKEYKMIAGREELGGGWEEILKALNEVFVSDKEFWLEEVKIESIEDAETEYLMARKDIRGSKEVPKYEKKSTLCVVAEYNSLLTSYQREGIDISQIICEEKITPKEIREIVCHTKYLWGNRGFSNPSGEREMVPIIRDAVGEILKKMVAANYKKAISLTQSKPEKKKKSQDKTLLRLKEENDRLKKQMAKHDSEVAALKSEFNADRKELISQRYALEKELEKLKPKQEETVCEEPEEEICEKEEKPIFTEDDFRAFTESHNILVWGMREKEGRYIKDRFPELKIFYANAKLSANQLSRYDGVIMATNKTSHSKYYSARDAFKNAGLPIAVLKNGSNSAKRFCMAGEELKGKLS